MDSGQLTGAFGQFLWREVRRSSDELGNSRALYYYIEKSIIFAKIFRLRVFSGCHQSAAFGVEYNIA